MLTDGLTARALLFVLLPTHMLPGLLASQSLSSVSRAFIVGVRVVVLRLPPDSLKHLHVPARASVLATHPFYFPA
jgi:hypothetical protein